MYFVDPRRGSDNRHVRMPSTFSNRRTTRTAITLFGLVVICLPSLMAASRAEAPSESAAEGLQATSQRSSPLAAADWAQLPLAFEANQGQADESVRYVARSDGFDLYLAANEAVFVQNASDDLAHDVVQSTISARPDTISRDSATQSVLRMQFANAGRMLEPVAADVLPGTVNYLIGSDPSAWRTGVPTFREVRYPGVWDGIDVVFHGRRERLEYDFAIQPGVDFEQIEVELVGADEIEIDSGGNLLVDVNGQRQVHRAPRVLQEQNGVSETLPGRFVIRGENRFGFAVDDHDPNRALLIDPEVVYATPFFGGSDNDNVFSIAAGRDGSVTIAGYTPSLDFPGTAPSSFQARESIGRSVPIRGDRGSTEPRRLTPRVGYLSCGQSWRRQQGVAGQCGRRRLCICLRRDQRNRLSDDPQCTRPHTRWRIL